jgi:pantoate--beta-alanine ligase
LEAALRDTIAAEPLTRIDYVAICDPHTLQPVGRLSGSVLVALAVFVGATRLIDNALLSVPPDTA